MGAGLAGLTAADALRRTGWTVTVLEARNRVGGRASTWRYAGGQWAEAGGEFIDTGHQHMRGLARRFGLRLDDLRQLGSDLDGATYLKGRRLRDTALYTPAVEREISRYQARLARLAAPLDAGDPVAAGAALDRRSAADLLDELRLDRVARMVIEHDIIRDDFGVEAAQLSLLALAQTEATDGGEPEVFRVHGGSDQIPRALARHLGRRVVLRAPVTKIADHGATVQITAAGRTYVAQQCIVAAPLPALRAVRFTPAPPPAVAAAIAGLRYGTGGKIALHCRERVWRKQGFNGDVFTDRPISTTWDDTDSESGSGGVLLAFTVGAPGRAWTALDAAGRIARAVADADAVFPGTRAVLADARQAWWSSERYTGGVYSAYGVGQVAAFWDALRRPFGRVTLAGEHTDDYWGYMEGAVRSGLRAAERLIAGARTA